MAQHISHCELWKIKENVLQVFYVMFFQAFLKYSCPLNTQYAHFCMHSNKTKIFNSLISWSDIFYSIYYLYVRTNYFKFNSNTKSMAVQILPNNLKQIGCRIGWLFIVWTSCWDTVKQRIDSIENSIILFFFIVSSRMERIINRHTQFTIYLRTPYWQYKLSQSHTTR